MPQNFIESRRAQGFLLPPDVREWLATDHLAWFVIGAVGEMDLAAFYSAYRADGHGRAAYEPSMMVTLLMYAYSTKHRSSRAIECHCRQDVAYRVITGNLVPDHATIARFVVRHERALAGLFGEVLRLCDTAGLVAPGVIAIDGSRLAGNANRNRNREFKQIAREILAEHKAIDEAEDEQFGDARGDELPEQLRTPEGRREFFRQAKQTRERQDTATAEPEPETEAGGEFEFDAERIVLAALRLEAELDAERAGNAAYEEYRVQGRMKNGRRFGSPPKPYQPPEVPQGQVNLTDPDSKLLKTTEGYVQGYNAQAVVDHGQIVLAAEITNSTVDWSQLDPMVSATIAELDRAGVAGRPQTALADTQYWNEEHIDEVIANKHVQVLIPPDSGTREQPRPGWTGGRYTWMRHVLASELGEQLYRKRKQMIEPVFGHTKHNRGVTRFHRRGRSAVRTEWRLLMATHNLTKLHRHQIGTAGA